MRRFHFAFPVLMLTAIAIAAGCGGGGGGATPFVSPAPTSTPTPHVGATTVPVGSTAPTAFIGDAGGNSAAFTMPNAVGASTANMTIALSTSLPGGAVVPATRRAISKTPLATIPKPQVAGVTVTPQEYISVVMDGVLPTSMSPTVTFGLRSPIPANTQTYLLLWDPQISWQKGWIVLLGPGTIGDPRNLVTFNGVPTGQTYGANLQYIYALVTTTQAVATATPAPTPSAAAVPAYCANYKVSSPQSGVTLNITDSSNLPGSILLVYVQQQAQSTPVVYNNIAWMDQNGNFGNAPVALPAACFSTTLGSGVSNNPLIIPHHHAGRVYFVYYGAPSPSAATAPNPFSSLAAHAAPNLGVGSAGGTWLYDKIEYNSDGGVVDTTQVDFLGLPIEMNVTSNGTATASPLPAALPSTCPAVPVQTTPFPIALPTVGTVVGVSQCNFAAIFNVMAKDTNYAPTVNRLPFNGTGPVVDYRINSPGGSFSFNPFDWNLFADVSPACPVAVGTPSGSSGYLACVLADYEAHPRVFNAPSSLGGLGDGLNFCITSDGNANFIAKAIGTSTSCSASPLPTTTPYAISGTPSPTNPNPLVKNPFNIPISLFTYALPASTPTPQPGHTAPPAPGCTYSELFGAPWGNAQVDSPAQAGTGAQLFATNDAFTLWKAMIVELSYGTALQPGTHPIESTPPTFGALFKDPLYNDYASYIHSYFDGGFAYAIAYDDAFNWYSGYGYSGTSANTINVRINPIPTASPATSATPAASPNPSSCNVVQPEVGAY